MMQADNKNDIQQLTVDIQLDFTDTQVDYAGLEKLVRDVCIRFGIIQGTVCIKIIGDQGIVDINRRFLGRESITDVISFDMSDETGIDFDILVNAQLAMRQAQQRGHPLKAELFLYVIHGLLHNLGFDDLNEQNAQKMHQREDEILEKAGLGRIYYNK